jgi:hypothetical protein
MEDQEETDGRAVPLDRNRGRVKRVQRNGPESWANMQKDLVFKTENDRVAHKSRAEMQEDQRIVAESAWARRGYEVDEDGDSCLADYEDEHGSLFDRRKL